jgi:N-acetylglucosaminyldiphosphoundecaprenol N-acetyl-beta-D-mannosaminyltransferase
VGEEAASKLCRMHPGMQIAGVEVPPFRPLTPEENRAMVQRVRDSQADILLVAFGQPKGEFWLYENYRELGVPACVQLGASFDFVTGRVRRAPRWCQRIGMECGGYADWQACGCNAIGWHYPMVSNG